MADIPQGGTGPSVYELAVNSGFIGTVAEWLASLKGEPGKDGAVRIDDLEAKEGDVLQYKDGHWQGAPVEMGGVGQVMVLGYDESIAYLDSDDDKEPTGGNVVYPDIMSYADTMAFLDGVE